MKEQSNQLTKLDNKYQILFDRIKEKINAFESKSDRVQYLRDLIRDSEKILDLLELFDTTNIEWNYLKNLRIGLNEIFKSLFENKPRQSIGYVSEEQGKYYISASYLGEPESIDHNGLGKLKLNLEIELANIVEGSESGSRNASSYTGVSKIKVKSSITDIVRIFEAMKAAEIISMKTSVAQFAELFFSETIDVKKYEANYNARKSEIANLGRNSYSKELENFIKIIIKDSFGKKDRVLESIIRYVEDIQNKRIY